MRGRAEVLEGAMRVLLSDAAEFERRAEDLVRPASWDLRCRPLAPLAPALGAFNPLPPPSRLRSSSRFGRRA